MFISFEGGEGSGKSTQARELHRKLLDAGLDAILVHEPGSTPLGNRLRHLLKSPRVKHITPLAELFVIAASRTQLVTELIQPNLLRGIIVVCDRYTESTKAYQGYARGVDFRSIELVNKISTQGIHPDLVFLLDVPAHVGLARKKSLRPDRFEDEEVAFHQRVRDGYLDLAGQDSQRWRVIDATLPLKQIRGRIWAEVQALLPNTTP